MRKLDDITIKYNHLKRAICKCGHTLYFISNHSAICDFCGRKVYPTKQCEFREKIDIALRKNIYKGEMTY